MTAGLHRHVVDGARRSPRQAAVVEPGRGEIDYATLDELSDRLRDRLALLLRSALKQLLSTFFEGKPENLVAALLDPKDQQLSKDEIEKIRSLIQPEGDN